jgi:hypothetical protein
MARQGSQEQLEQSDMRCAFNMGNMARARYSVTDIEETECRTKKRSTEVREEMKPGVEFPGHRMVKTVTEAT